MEQRKTRKGIIKIKSFEINLKKNEREKHTQQSNQSGKMNEKKKTTTKNKSVSGNQSTPQQTKHSRVFFVGKLLIWTHSEPGRKNKARSARVAACVRRGFTMAHAGYNSNKRHKQKAVAASTPKWTWMAPPPMEF